MFLRFLNFDFFESNHRFGVLAVFKFLDSPRTNTIFGVFAASEFLNFQRATTVLVVSRFLDRYLYILFKKLVNIQYVQCMCFVYNKHRILHRQTTTNVYHISVITNNIQYVIYKVWQRHTHIYIIYMYITYLVIDIIIIDLLTDIPRQVVTKRNWPTTQSRMMQVHGNTVAKLVMPPAKS